MASTANASATTPTSVTSPFFTKLPPEVRNKIYEYAKEEISIEQHAPEGADDIRRQNEARAQFVKDVGGAHVPFFVYRVYSPMDFSTSRTFHVHLTSGQWTVSSQFRQESMGIQFPRDIMLEHLEQFTAAHKTRQWMAATPDACLKRIRSVRVQHYADFHVTEKAKLMVAERLQLDHIPTAGRQARPVLFRFSIPKGTNTLQVSTYCRLDAAQAQALKKEVNTWAAQFKLGHQFTGIDLLNAALLVKDQEYHIHPHGGWKITADEDEADKLEATEPYDCYHGCDDAAGCWGFGCGKSSLYYPRELVDDYKYLVVEITGLSEEVAKLSMEDASVPAKAAWKKGKKAKWQKMAIEY